MDLSAPALIVPRHGRPTLSWSPHPLLPAHERAIYFAGFLPDETIGAYLRRVGLEEQLRGRSVILTVDGARLPRALWERAHPRPGALINIVATVRGGGSGGGKNPVAIVAMVALMYFAPYAAVEIGGAEAGTATALTAYGTLLRAGIVIIGGMAINKLFPPPKPVLTDAQANNGSPTYALTGGANRARPFEPMPVILGVYKVVPDVGAQPYTEFRGADQYLYQVFDFGYNDVDLSNFAIGTTPIESFDGVTVQISGPSGALTLFPGNVDSIAGADLPIGVWVQRTSSPAARQLAVEITGTLFRIDGQGNVAIADALMHLQYRAVGAAAWIDLIFASDANTDNIILDQAGNPIGTSFISEFEFETGSPPGPGYVEIDNGTTTPVRRTYAWTVSQGQYEVRVQYVSSVITEFRGGGVQLLWSQLRTFQSDTFDYSGRKRVMLAIKASGQLNGVVDQLNAIARAKCATFGEGYALQFDGASAQRVTLPAGVTAALNGTTWAIEGWIRGNDTVTTRAILGPRGLNHGREISAAAWAGAGKISFAEEMIAVVANTSIAFAAGEVFHMIYTYDGASIRTYKNGALVNGPTTYAFTGNCAGPYSFSDVEGVAHSWLGLLDGMRIYSRALSAIEVAEHFNGIFRDERGLVGKWEFDEGAGTVALDSSGNGNDGALVNGPTYVANPQTWGVRQTSNPAWWYQAVAAGRYVNGRLVWGAGLAGSRIDTAGLKAFATFCAANNLTFNGVFDQQLSAFDMLSEIALAGRGTVAYPGGKLGVVWDAPSQPTVAVFGMHNIVAGSFEIDYATQQLADEILCTFNNPDLNWTQDSVRALVPGATAPTRTRQIELFGCTNKDLAGRDANLYAAQNAYRTRTYKWRSDFEGMVATRGEVVEFSHDLASLDYSGRFIEGGNASLLTLPRAVPLYSSGGFVIIVKPDGTFASYAVAGGTGLSATLTPIGALPFNPWADANHPPYDYRWHYGATATPGKKVKIDSAKPVDGRTVELTAVDELDIFYSAESNPYTYVAPRQSFGGVPEISSLALAENGVRAGRGYLVRVTISWNVGADFGFADVRTSVNGAPLDLVAQNLNALGFDIIVSDGDDVTAQVTIYGRLGRLGKSATASISKIIDFAGIAPPDDVTGFDLSGGTFRWDESPNVDVVGYRILFHYGSRSTWQDGAPIHQGVITDNPYTPATMPTGQCVFMLVAVDAAGLESLNPALIYSDLGDAAIANVVETYDFKAAGWPGTITNGTIAGGVIQATSGTKFYGPDDGGPLYSSNDSDPFYAPTVWDVLTYETLSFAPATEEVGSNMTLSFGVAGDPVFVEHRPIGASTALYSNFDTDPFYAVLDTDPFYDAIPDYAAWPGQMVTKDVAIQLRVRTGQGNTQGIISALTLVMDVPDIGETLNGISISNAGTRLPIAKTYRQIEGVQLTLRSDGGAAVTATVEDHNASVGPLVKTRDAALNPVSGTVNATIQGF